MTRAHVQQASDVQVNPAGPTVVRERLQDGCVSEKTRMLSEVLTARIIGQEEAIEALTCSFARLLTGLRDPDRPALTLLLLGPTGVGKTETARALAHAIFGSEHALTQINCEEYTHGHEVSKLLGAPPGYVGFGLQPLLSQRRLDEAHAHAIRAKTGFVGQFYDIEGAHEPPLSVVLFDEIEKAHPAIWNAMLGILEDGRLTLGDNTTTDFTHSIILMTSNAGSRDMGALLEGQPIGFRGTQASQPDRIALKQSALSAARERFPLEFMNRFDQVLVYQPLGRADLERIFQKFLAEIHVRALEQARVPLLVRVSPEARDLVIDHGIDPALGARPLRRAVEADLIDPLSRLIANHRIEAGDVIDVERDGAGLAFYRTSSHAGARPPS
jgi:ATP-dependent Clp protease ATP-binding subunit ClpC